MRKLTAMLAAMMLCAMCACSPAGSPGNSASDPMFDDDSFGSLSSGYSDSGDNADGTSSGGSGAVEYTASDAFKIFDKASAAASALTNYDADASAIYAVSVDGTSVELLKRTLSAVQNGSGDYFHVVTINTKDEHNQPLLQTNDSIFASKSRGKLYTYISTSDLTGMTDGVSSTLVSKYYNGKLGDALGIEFGFSAADISGVSAVSGSNGESFKFTISADRASGIVLAAIKEAMPKYGAVKAEVSSFVVTAEIDASGTLVSRTDAVSCIVTHSDGSLNAMSISRNFAVNSYGSLGITVEAPAWAE